MIKHILLTVCCIVAIVSCRETGIKSSLKQFIGQEITIPDNEFRTLVNGRDTTVADFFRADAKLVVYYDSTTCSMCQLGKIYQWEEARAISIGSGHRFNLVFILSPKKGITDQIITSLRTYRFDYPVFIDSAGRFEALNPQLPSNRSFRTFLLDGHNRVVLAGYPINNEKLWDLYKQQISQHIRRQK